MPGTLFTPCVHERKLFEVSGAAGTFNAKIDLAYSLGLYGKKTYHELNLIRKIRNKFAHFETPLHFDSKEIADQCAALWFPKNVEINKQPIAPKEARTQYLRAINILNSLLWTATRRPYTKVDEHPSDLP